MYLPELMCANFVVFTALYGLWNTFTIRILSITVHIKAAVILECPQHKTAAVLVTCIH